MQLVLHILQRDQAVAHEKVLVALVRDRLLQFVPVDFAGRGVRVLSRARVLAAVRDVFCRFVELGEVLLAQFLIDFKEPVRVKAPVVELFRRQRRISRNNCLLAVVEALVHVRHEVVAAALKSVDPEHLFREVQPLRGVHGDFDQPVGAHFVLLHRFFQVRRRLSCDHSPGLRSRRGLFFRDHSPGL